MAINQEIDKAIDQSVSRKEQPDAVAKRIKAWLHELSESKTLERQQHSGHIESVLAAIKVKQSDVDDGY